MPSLRHPSAPRVLAASPAPPRVSSPCTCCACACLQVRGQRRRREQPGCAGAEGWQEQHRRAGQPRQVPLRQRLPLWRLHLVHQCVVAQQQQATSSQSGVAGGRGGMHAGTPSPRSFSCCASPRSRSLTAWAPPRSHRPRHAHPPPLTLPPAVRCPSLPQARPGPRAASCPTRCRPPACWTCRRRPTRRARSTTSSRC